jgi:hypothetical protein
VVTPTIGVETPEVTAGPEGSVPRARRAVRTRVPETTRAVTTGAETTTTDTTMAPPPTSSTGLIETL